MMGHPGPAELVDLAEGGGAPETAAHVEVCASCRDDLNGLTAMIALHATARDGGDVPEPSPLFWTHFPRRVGTALESAVRHEPGWRASGLTVRNAVFALTVAITIGMVAGVAISRVPRDGRAKASNLGSASTALSTAGPDYSEVGPVVDPRWAVVVQMAEAAGWDAPEATELFAMDGAADRAIFELSIDERRELRRLLEIELRQ
jgi:hypothetical protein